MKNSLFMNRLLAFLYDIVLQLILLLIIYIGLNFFSDTYLKHTTLKNMVFIGAILFVFLILFTVLPLKLKGTFGKMMTDLEVVPTNGRMTIGRWLFRELIFKYLYPYLGVTLFIIFLKPKDFNYLLIYLGLGLFVEFGFILIKRKTVHDYFLKTKVIKKEKSDLIVRNKKESIE